MAMVLLAKAIGEGDMRMTLCDFDNVIRSPLQKTRTRSKVSVAISKGGYILVSSGAEKPPTLTPHPSPFAVHRF
jgi:hypothetical protein